MHTNLRPHHALAALLVLIAAPARADVVRSEPDDCPDGSFGNTSHCGPYCEALLCTNDRDCTDGRTCQPVKACAHTYDCFDPPPTVHGGPCTNGTSCTDAKDTCQSLKLCISNENPTTDDSGSSGTNPGTTTGTPGTTTSPTTDPGPTSAGPTTTSSDTTGNNATSSTGATTSNNGTGDKGCACTLTDEPGAPRAALALLLLAALPRRRTVSAR